MLSHRLQETSLRYFLEVVRCGSLTEAAVRLNVTASAVSRQVAMLEAALGVPLFDRRPRGMAPSAAGELLAAHARRGALEADRVVSDIQGLQGLRRGRVRLASSAGFAIEFLPRAIAAFRERHPGIQFHLRVASPMEVTTAVLHGDADIGLTYSRTAEQGIRVEHRQPAQLLMDLSLNLRSLISQRLIPTEDGHGRIAAVEILLNTPLISDLIFKGEVGEIKEIMKKSRNLGMQTFDQALFDLFETNMISFEDALRNADSANDLRLQIKLNSQRARTTDLSAGTEHFAIV